MSNEVIVSIISTTGVVITSIIALFQTRQKRNLKWQVKDLSSGFIMNMQQLNELNQLVLKLFKHTSADRFLILTAHNGRKELRVASAIFEDHKHIGNAKVQFGATTKYVGFEFDNHYLNMLKAVELYGSQHIVVAELPPCDLKNIYQDEEVVDSVVCFAARVPIDGKNDRLFYFSVATHSLNGFPDTDKHIIKVLQGGIKAIIKSAFKE